MLRASRTNSQKSALTTTRQVSFSCGDVTSRQKGTARGGVMVRATMVLKGPRSMKAAATVIPVPASKASQIATEELSEEMCSETCSEVCSGICPEADL